MWKRVYILFVLIGKPRLTRLNSDKNGTLWQKKTGHYDRKK